MQLFEHLNCEVLHLFIKQIVVGMNIKRFLSSFHEELQNYVFQRTFFTKKYLGKGAVCSISPFEDGYSIEHLLLIIFTKKFMVLRSDKLF